MIGSLPLKRLLASFGIACWLSLTPGIAFAQSTIDVPLEDATEESRAKSIFKILRCLVCQNQSIDDSNAGLARDLRVLVRQRIASGDNDDQAIGYIVDRYGDWVLLQPPFKSATLVLWLGPLVIFLLGVGGIVLYMRRRKVEAVVAPVALSEEENRRLAALLDETDRRDGPA